MTHVRLARTVALWTAAALVLIPAAAFAQDTGTPMPTAGSPVTPTDPTVTPRPAPVIVVRSYGTTPERILVGSPFELTVAVYNATQRRAENVVVSLGAAATPAAAGAAAAGVSVLGTGNAKFLGALRGQVEDAVTFQAMVGPGTAPGALSVPVTVSFEYLGIRQEVDYTIGLVVERDAALSVVTAEVPEKAMEGETFPATFEVANTGGFALSGVTLSVEASGAAVTDPTLFIGTLDAASTEAIDVSITPKNAGPLEVFVVLSYRDDFGRTQEFRESRTVSVEAVGKKSEPGAQETDKPEEPNEEGNWFTRFIKALFGLGS